MHCIYATAYLSQNAFSHLTTGNEWQWFQKQEINTSITVHFFVCLADDGFVAIYYISNAVVTFTAVLN